MATHDHSLSELLPGIRVLPSLPSLPPFSLLLLTLLEAPAALTALGESFLSMSALKILDEPLDSHRICLLPKNLHGDKPQKEHVIKESPGTRQPPARPTVSKGLCASENSLMTSITVFQALALFHL